MTLNQIYAIYFSPTGGTRTVVTRLAESLGRAFALPVKEIDFTPPAAREKIYHFDEHDLVVFGSPVYADRLPNKISPDMRRCFKGENTIAVPVVAYGNRSYGGALTEFRLILEENGFLIAGGAAAVCQHAFNSELAAGRPDAKDLEEIREFSLHITEKLKNAGDFDALHLDPDTELPPYYTPKKEDGTPAKFLAAKPETAQDKCRHCGICRDVCPMGSIDDRMQAEGICIKCQACVKKCPMQAKYFTDKDFLSHMRMLGENYADQRSENYFVY